MTPNKRYRPGQVRAMGPLRFDVDTALAILAKASREPVAVDVDSYAKFLGFKPDTDEPGREPVLRPVIDTAHAMRTELALPLILGSLRMPNGRVLTLVIDGMHRLYKANRLGIDILPAYVLTEAETQHLTWREEGQ